ncbi:MAG TPA: PEP-CTERM sorting domain-containing protein [Lacipirellulaceae bacterium]
MRWFTNRSDGKSARGLGTSCGLWGGGLLVAVLMVGLQPVDAATITWSAPLVVDADTDVGTGGNVHFAADFNTADGFGPDDGIINGIAFMQVGSAGIPGRLTHTFASGPNNGAAGFAASPPAGMDLDLVELLDSHSWHPGNPQTAMVTLEGLTVGNPYQIQVIGAVDLRTCCAGRIYEPDDGTGNFTTGTTVQRGLVQSIIGSFTADASTQTFQWRSLGGLEGNNDPAMSGLVLLQIPEPNSMLLVALALGFWATAGWRRQG